MQVSNGQLLVTEQRQTEDPEAAVNRKRGGTNTLCETKLRHGPFQGSEDST